MEIERHRREAKNIGINIGINIGRKENSRKIALSMLQEQIPPNVIAKCTSLSEQEIHDLAQKHNLL